MGFYRVTAERRSVLHPRAAAKLGFGTLVPGQVHELDADVAADFLPRTTEVPGPAKRDVKSGKLKATKRKVKHPGLLVKITKKEATEVSAGLEQEPEAEADELDE